MTSKSGRYFKKKSNYGSVASKTSFKNRKLLTRRRHRYKSQSHRIILINNYFSEPESEQSLPSGENNSFPKYQFSTIIPEYYDESYLCTLPINPGNMFTYWELPHDLIENNTDPDSKFFMRLKKISDSEDIFQKIATIGSFQAAIESTEEDYQDPTNINLGILEQTGQLYIEIPELGEFYKAEIVQSTEKEDKVLIAQLETITFSSHITDNFLNCISLPSQTKDYFDKLEQGTEQKQLTTVQISTAEPYKQNLGSASL